MPRVARFQTPVLLAAHSHVHTGTCIVFFPTNFRAKERLLVVQVVTCIITVAVRFPLIIVTCVSVYSRWAHIGCAVAVPEVFFVNVNLREGINTDQITSARRKLVSSTDFFLFNLVGKVNVCFCNCVTPCTVLCNLFCHALFFLLSYALS